MAAFHVRHYRSNSGPRACAAGTLLTGPSFWPRFWLWPVLWGWVLTFTVDTLHSVFYQNGQGRRRIGGRSGDTHLLRKHEEHWIPSTHVSAGRCGGPTATQHWEVQTGSTEHTSLLRLAKSLSSPYKGDPTSMNYLGEQLRKTLISGLYTTSYEQKAQKHAHTHTKTYHRHLTIEAFV